MTKGEIINLLYSPAERLNIDVAIPHGAVPPEDAVHYVMDYNNNHVFGVLVDLRELAKTKPEVEQRIKDEATYSGTGL